MAEPVGAAPATGSLILDTHVWLWVVGGTRERLSARAIEEVEEAGRRGDVLVSAISVWEVAMLEAKGRISLARTIDDWIGAALGAPGVRLLPLLPDIAIESTRVPGGGPGDPVDRMLIAGARVTGARLATCDREILEYAEAGHVAVLDARP